uniref:Uncharacterized protein n=1 Tax=Anopheles melas TaxID=34690 RepID=A0A182U735_9DIPT
MKNVPKGLVSTLVVADRSRLVDDRVEARVLVGGVVDGAHGTVRFDQRVLTFDDITVARFVLRLHVPGVEVVDSAYLGGACWRSEAKPEGSVKVVQTGTPGPRITYVVVNVLILVVFVMSMAVTERDARHLAILVMAGVELMLRAVVVTVATGEGGGEGNQRCKYHKLPSVEKVREEKCVLSQVNGGKFVISSAVGFRARSVTQASLIERQ